MGAPSAPLNAEPALPSERKEQHLALKSYADAVEEAPPTSAYNGTHNGTGANGEKSSEVNRSSTATEPATHTAAVLRIVTSGSEPEDTKERKPVLARQESKHEYSATVSLY